MPKPKGQKKQQTRNTARVMVSLYPEDLRMLDEIAEHIKEPGAEANRSQAVRFVVRKAKELLKEKGFAV